MAKYNVSVKVDQRRYFTVEADSDEEAMRLACEADARGEEPYAVHLDRDAVFCLKAD